MRKLIAAIVLICMLCSFAIADEDLLSNYRIIVNRMLLSQEYNTVLLPAGIWVIGTDIPAGTYSARAVDICHVAGFDPDGVLQWSEGLWEKHSIDSFSLIDGWRIDLSSNMILIRLEE